MEGIKELEAAIEQFAKANKNRIESVRKDISKLPEGQHKTLLKQALKDAKKGTLDVTKFIKSVQKCQ